MRMANGVRCGLVVLTALITAAVARAGEEKINPRKLPAAVKQAVEKKFPEAKIRGAAREEKDGKTTYEVELTVEGHAVDLALGAEGEILEVEKEVAVETLPKAVRKKLDARFPGARIEKVEEVTRGEGGPVHYEVAIKAEVVLTAKGKIVKGEGDDDEDEEHEAKGKKRDKD